MFLLKGTGLNDRSEKAEEEKWGRKRTAVGTDSSTTVSFTDNSWDHVAKAMPWPAQRSEVGGGGVTEVFLPGGHYEKMNEVQQVHACSLSGKRLPRDTCSLSRPSRWLWF